MASGQQGADAPQGGDAPQGTPGSSGTPGTNAPRNLMSVEWLEKVGTMAQQYRRVLELSVRDPDRIDTLVSNYVEELMYPVSQTPGPSAMAPIVKAAPSTMGPAPITVQGTPGQLAPDGTPWLLPVPPQGGWTTPVPTATQATTVPQQHVPVLPTPVQQQQVPVYLHTAQGLAAVQQHVDKNPWSDLRPPVPGQPSSSAAGQKGYAPQEPKGKGKRTYEEGPGKGPGKGIFYNDNVRALLARHKAFLREVTKYLAKELGMTIEDYVRDQGTNVSEAYALWYSRLDQGTIASLSFEDEARIEHEWNLCILRMMLFMRIGCFRDPRWRTFEEGLMITHSGHLMDPDTYVVIWMEAGRLKPSCTCTIPGFRTAGFGHNALSRHRGEQATFDDETQRRPRDRHCVWPPMSMRFPDELFERRGKVPQNHCYVCNEEGHHAHSCPYYWAWLYATPEGRNFMHRQGYEVPELSQKATKAHAKALLEVLNYHWPLVKAMSLARQVHTEENPDNFLEDLGDYVDKERMAIALGYPRKWK